MTGGGAKARCWWAVVAATIAVVGGCGTGSHATQPASSSNRAASTLVIATDLPMQGRDAVMADDVIDAVKLVLAQAGGHAGRFRVTVRAYDHSTPSAPWDRAKCQRNAALHASRPDEVAVIGPYNTPCIKAELPTANEATGGALSFISFSSTNPALVKPWGREQPDSYYPSATRNLVRMLATDDIQGIAAADYAKRTLHASRCGVVADQGYDLTYGPGLAAAFTDEAARIGLHTLAPTPWNPAQTSYRPLFTTLRQRRVDCVYIAGIYEDNGARLLTDEQAVLGPYAAVHVIASDGFTAYPELNASPQAQGLILTFPGQPVSAMTNQSTTASTFAATFNHVYGHSPVSMYTLYAAAATQLILRAITASDGSRQAIRTALFGGTYLPKDEAISGEATGIAPNTGDARTKTIAFEVIRDGDESYTHTVIITRDPGLDG